MSNQTVIYLSEPDLKPWLQSQSKAQGVSLSKLITNYLAAIKTQQTQSQKNIFLELSELLNQKDADEFDKILQKSKKNNKEKPNSYYQNLFK
jgi:Asp-tRNA(Asn)/Glu-tRNA(Gln) amidotransferase A subunit family amidase